MKPHTQSRWRLLADRISRVPRRLALKLIVTLTIVLAVAEGISGYFNAKTQERQLVEAMVVGADQLSRAIASATWHSMRADHRAAAYEMMQTIALKQGITTIRIFNKEGRVMFSTTAGDNGQVDKRAEACYVCHADEQPLVKVDVPSRARTFAGPDGMRRLAMVTPIYNEPSCSEAPCHAHPREMNVLGVLDVVLSLDRVDAEVAGIEKQALLLTGIHMFLIAIVVAFFTRHFVDVPIRKLIGGTRAVSAMQLDRPIEIDSSEELAELARSFNVMRERLTHALTDLNRLTRELESKVDERTRELETAHAALLQSNRLASLGQLAASVAHEINNPLSGVLNLTMLMERILKDDGIPPGRVEEFRRFLSQASRETSRVARIVSDLLTFSRRARPRRIPTDVNGIVRATVDLLSHKLGLAHVRTQLDLQENLPTVECDGSQIQQVVTNLVVNGSEATNAKGGGTIVIRTVTVPGSGWVTLEVRDDGEGIEPEILPKIFDPFFTTKEEGKSVGLGLAVVYGIVEGHGGEIHATSRRGEGSTFTVTLPLSHREVGLASSAGSFSMDK